MKAATKLPFLENIVKAVPNRPLVGGVAFVKPRYTTVDVTSTEPAEDSSQTMTATASGAAKVTSGTGLYAAKGKMDSYSGQFTSPHIHRGISNPGASGGFSGQVLMMAAWDRHRELAEKGKVDQPPMQFDQAYCEQQLLYWDDKCCVVADAYPKSTFHFLVLPRDRSLLSLNELKRSNADHVTMLKHMRKIADAIITTIQSEENVFDDGCRMSAWGQQCVSPLHAQFREMELGGGSMSTKKKEDDDAEKKKKAAANRGLGGVSAAASFHQQQQGVEEIGKEAEQEKSTKEEDSEGDDKPKAGQEEGQPTPPPLRSGINRLRFMQGFHAIPSLPTLHMHVLSLDLTSGFMKKKQHYNSFTTPFFLTAERVENDLLQNGEITMNRNLQNLTRFEKQNLMCVWCGQDCNNGGMPVLKAHLKQCEKNRSFIDTPN